MNDCSMNGRAARICRGLLVRVGVASALTVAAVAVTYCRILPGLSSMDYSKIDTADLRMALNFAPLMLLSASCLCVAPLLGSTGGRLFGRLSVVCVVASLVLLSCAVVDMMATRRITVFYGFAVFSSSLAVVHVAMAGVRSLLAWISHDGGEADPARLTVVWAVIVFVVGLVTR